MAVLSNAGAHCSVPDCSQLDFLPFTCAQCQQVFCLEHFPFEAHACPNGRALDARVLVCPLCGKSMRLEASEDPNLTWERHVLTDCTNPEGGEHRAKKARCPVKGCKEQISESNSITCGRCQQKVCLKHRYEEEHPCFEAPKARAKAALRAAAPKASTKARTPTASPASQGWQCTCCTLVNPSSASMCSACGAPPDDGWELGPATAAGGSHLPAMISPTQEAWSCDCCTLENPGAAVACEACGAPRGAAPAPALAAGLDRAAAPAGRAAADPAGGGSKACVLS